MKHITLISLTGSSMIDLQETMSYGLLVPGGCGKSFVIKSFRASHPNLKIHCMSKTGAAAQNINGVTMDSYPFRMTEFPDVIIVDEISMTSEREILLWISSEESS